MWEKTVMKDKDFKKLNKDYPGVEGLKPVILAVTTRQAEISFKAGYEKRKEEVIETTVSLADMCMKHRKFGIQEVVEWFKNNYHGDWLTHYNQWQAKLKEWGIKEEK